MESPDTHNMGLVAGAGDRALCSPLLPSFVFRCCWGRCYHDQCKGKGIGSWSQMLTDCSLLSSRSLEKAHRVQTWCRPSSCFSLSDPLSLYIFVIYILSSSCPSVSSAVGLCLSLAVSFCLSVFVHLSADLCFLFFFFVNLLLSLLLSHSSLLLCLHLFLY